MIEHDPEESELDDSAVQLYRSEDLGSKVPWAGVAFEYYDLSMPPASTLVLGACTGRDSAVEEIFHL